MKYITSTERMARDEGRQEGRNETIAKSLALILESKFGDKGAAFAEELRRVGNPTKASEIFDAICAGKDLDQLRNKL